MKFKALSIGLVFALALASCKKDKVEEEIQNETNGGSTPTVEVIPNTFTKRVIIEKFSGEWCGYCPDAAVILDNLIAANNGNVIGVSLQGGDPFETPHTNYMDNATLRYDITGYPAGVVDRKTSSSYSRSSWSSKVTPALAETAKLGIKLETSIEGNLLDVKARVVSNEVLPNAYITLYIVENNIPESSYGAQSGAAAGYVHQHVLRKVLASSPHGDDLNIDEARKEVQQVYNDIDISAYKAADLKVVAIVNEHAAFNPSVLKAYNSTEVKAGENSTWE